MKKNIKDYLRLYIGCDVLRPDGKTPLTIQGISSNIVIFENDLSGEQYGDALKAKLILRPLSSMTEEEMNECGNLDYDFSSDPELNTWNSTYFDCLISPNQFIWLLKNRFDLFGLIEAGLAIDKAILK